MAEPALRIRNLSVQFPGPAGPLTPVDGVTLTIPKGKVVGLVGESGCGKSLTALSVLGLLPPPGRVSGGEILFAGQDLAALPEGEMRKLRGDRIAMIFQDPMTSLNPLTPVGKQVAEVLRLHRGLTRAQAKARTAALFAQVGIPDPAARLRAYPRELSGGLRQRVMIAMAMACRPELLLADEPTTALDVTIQAQILAELSALCRQEGTAILLITHNMGVVAQLCDYVYVMYAGQIVEAAETFALFAAPRHPYTLGLLGAIPSLEGEGARLRAIPGSVPPLGTVFPGCPFAPRCEACRAACLEGPPALEEWEKGHWVRCRREGSA